VTGRIVPDNASGVNLVFERDVEIPMRDGVVLRADVCRPAGEGTHPVLLQRTVYNKSTVEPPLASVRGPAMLDIIRAASNGYAMVIEDERGRFASDGEFRLFEDAGDDGYDSVEWCASQRWSNGRVGMYGISHVGLVQWLAALTTPPHLVCIAPWMSASNLWANWIMRNGVLELAFTTSWTAGNLAVGALAREDDPVRSERLGRLRGRLREMRAMYDRLPVGEFPEVEGLVPSFADWVDHPAYDEFWERFDIEAHYEQITVPAFHMVGWYDIFLDGSLRNFSGMRERGGSPTAKDGQKLVLGPWTHTAPDAGRMLPSQSGDLDFGMEAALEFDSPLLRWFDRWLKGDGTAPAGERPISLFVMGENTWRDEDEWPLARTRWTSYFLHSGGSANTLDGDGRLDTEPPSGDEPADVFVYDPGDPTPSVGGSQCCWAWDSPAGAHDQRPVERRDDVLVFTTETLDGPVEVTGPVVVHLFASTSVFDTDFTATLVDVHPCGYAQNLQVGIVRGRFRESRTDPSLLTPGQVYELTVDLWSTSNVFGAGHRIRLDIASASFPKFDRNPNTGGPLFRDARLQAATQRIWHDRSHPSHVVLPVIPR